MLNENIAGKAREAIQLMRAGSLASNFAAIQQSLAQSGGCHHVSSLVRSNNLKHLDDPRLERRNIGFALSVFGGDVELFPGSSWLLKFQSTYGHVQVPSAVVTSLNSSAEDCPEDSNVRPFKR